MEGQESKKETSITMQFKKKETKKQNKYRQPIKYGSELHRKKLITKGEREEERSRDGIKLEKYGSSSTSLQSGQPLEFLSLNSEIKKLKLRIKTRKGWKRVNLVTKI